MPPADSDKSKPERFSKIVAPEGPPLSDDERRDLESENGLRQVDLMDRMIDEAIAGASEGRRFRFRPSHLLDLNREAVDKLSSSAGSYRTNQIQITGSTHNPPDARRVARLVEEMCDLVNERWEQESAIWLASYVMWRTNWIHPFEDGNGRTSRTASYLVLCAKLGHRLPGERTIPEFIAEDKSAYYEALEMCDNACEHDVLGVSGMEDLLSNLLSRQLLTVVNKASGR
jgi:Fic family protein